MSLKIFHIFFILVSTLLCASVAWWCSVNGVAKEWIWLFAAGRSFCPFTAFGF